MTLDDLDAKFREASWLIAKRSTVAAGQALIFSVGSLDDAAEEVAAIYALSGEEKARVQPTHAHAALESVQTAASSLFGETLGMSAGQAASAAKKAVASGKKLTFLKTLMQAGPKAANLAVSGGKAAGNAAGKSTPWGWIATAAYAVGTGSWYAYNLHAFNIAAYDLVRLRERIELPPERSDEHGLLSAETFAPVLSSLSTSASAVGRQASAAWDGALDAGGHVASATSGFFGRLSARLRKSPATALDDEAEKKFSCSSPPLSHSGSV
ncbi:hypothetical protein [Sphingomonas sp. CFBP 8760]|uniref:hypothetical protein n=1 Tax=Sphingomonas sp. CFBP 8760 TaxID=2775282 RepID=UPI001781B89A|nr:hypothetical protein [Sphingomonas sp. CFBP 8760]MBD8546797.1 hypothetical protein [Sphingomonas sp. CFBP 8760]